MNPLMKIQFDNVERDLQALVNHCDYDDLHELKLHLKNVLAQLENKQYRLYREKNGTVK